MITLIVLAGLLAGMVGVVSASAGMLTSNPVTITAPVYQLKWYVKDAHGNWVGFHEMAGIEGFSLADTLFTEGATIQRSDIPAYPSADAAGTPRQEYTEQNGYFTGRWLWNNDQPVGVGTRVMGEMNIYAEYAAQSRPAYAVTVTDETDYAALGGATPGALSGASDAANEHTDHTLVWQYPQGADGAAFAIDWLRINGELVEDYPKESVSLTLRDITADQHVSFAFRAVDPAQLVAYSARQETGVYEGLSSVTPAEGKVEIGGDVQFQFDMIYGGSQKNEVARVMVNGVRVEDFERGAWEYTVRNVQEPFTLTYSVIPVIGKPTVTVVPTATYHEGDAEPSYGFTFSGEAEADTEAVRGAIQRAVDAGRVRFASAVDTTTLAGTVAQVTMFGEVPQLDAEYYLFYEEGTVTVGERIAPSGGKITYYSNYAQELGQAERAIAEADRHQVGDSVSLRGAGDVASFDAEGFGLSLVGWSKTRDGSMVLADSMVYDTEGDLQLYAVWKTSEPEPEQAGHRVEVVSTGHGTITYPDAADGVVHVADGAPLVIAFLADTGYAVDSIEVHYNGLWIPLPGELSPNAFSIDSVTGPLSLRVNFVQDAANVLTFDAVGGKIISPAEDEVAITEGETIPIAFEPDDGYVFDNAQLREEGGEWETLTDITASGGVIEAPAGNATLRVLFAPQDLPSSDVTVSLRAVNGSITDPADDTETVENGGSLTIIYAANEGFVFGSAQTRVADGDWTDVPDATETGCELLDITEDTEFRVTFDAEMAAQHRVSFSALDGGSILSPVAGGGSLLVSHNDSMRVTYEADLGYQLDVVRVKIGEADWIDAEPGSTEGVFEQAQVTDKTEIEIHFRELDENVKLVTIRPVVTYIYGEPTPEVTLAVDGEMEPEERAALRETAQAALKSGAITVTVDSDDMTQAGEKGNATISGAQDALGEGYVALFENSTYIVAKRPVLIRARSERITLGETYTRAALIGPYNKVGGKMNREGEVLKYGMTLKESATVTEVGQYTLAIVPDEEGSPNYEIHTEDGTLYVMGKVTYHSNYPAGFPEGQPLENKSFVDAVSYERDAKVTLPAASDVGFSGMGLTFAGWLVDGKPVGAGTKLAMGASHLEIDASWTKTQYMLTVQHYLEGSTQSISTADTFLHAYGDAYTAASKQVAGYTAVTQGQTGTMPANELTVTIYYKVNESGGGSSVPGVVPGGGSGGSSAGGGGAGSGDASGADGVDVALEGGGGGGGGQGGTGGGQQQAAGDEGTGGAAGTQPAGEGSQDSGRPNYVIRENDVPLGGVAARNVGDCFE